MYLRNTSLGRHVRREVLAEHLKTLGKRLNKVPEFAAYALADGIRRAFTRFGKWVRAKADAAAEGAARAVAPLLPGFAEWLVIDDG